MQIVYDPENKVFRWRTSLVINDVPLTLFYHLTGSDMRSGLMSVLRRLFPDVGPMESFDAVDLTRQGIAYAKEHGSLNGWNKLENMPVPEVMP